MVSEDNKSTVVPSPDLEIKDAKVIFKSIWGELEEEYGRRNLTFPKELILLGGAPGAGKGTHTRFINKSRGLTCPPIVVSSLLNSPEAEKIKSQGRMVGDKEATGLVFRELLKQEYRDGVVLDGFPRTKTQVECLKLLVDQVDQLHGEFSDTSLAINFRRPTIHAMVLFVGEKTSVERQLKRGWEVKVQNEKIEETGVGVLQQVRETDLDPEKARRRYRVFKEQTWDALQSLREIYHYHFINAEGAIDEVESNIVRELQYQSSLELDPKTFDRLAPIPLAEEITVHARQELVRRLDGYELEHRDMFVKVVALIQDAFMPIITRHALSGRAIVNSEEKIFEDPMALKMLIDIFSERGFYAMVDKTIKQTPTRFDVNTGKVELASSTVFRIHIRFEGSSIRRG